MDAIAIPPVVSMATDGMAVTSVFAMTVLAGTAMGIYLFRRSNAPIVNRAIRRLLLVVGILAALLTGAGLAASAGPPGNVTPQGLSGYEIVTAVTETSAYNVQSTSAKCSRGKKVLGGGASILGSSGAAVFWNGPARTTSTGSWAAAAHEITPTAGPWSLEVYAICAHASAATRGD